MKAIKNKRRFDPRWHHSERLESKEQEINEIKVNFNSFNLDTWMDEDVVKEYVLDPSVSRGSEERKVPKMKGGKPKKPASQAEQDERLRNLRDGEVRSKDLEEMCGGAEMGPEEEEPAITDLGPDEAFGAGYTAAVEEIMASLEGLLGDPIEMGPAPEEEEGAVDISAIFEEDDELSDEERIQRNISRADKMTKGKTPGRTDYSSKTPPLKNPVKAGRLAEEGEESSKMDLAIDAMMAKFALPEVRADLKKNDPELYKKMMEIVQLRIDTPVGPEGEAQRYRDEERGD